MYWERSFGNKLKSGCLSKKQERFHKRIWIINEAIVQADEAAAEIARKLEKQKKCLKKEKKELAVPALVSSENSSSTPKECEEKSERPTRKKKQKPHEAP